MVEPAFADRHVHLSRKPFLTVAFAMIQDRIFRASRCEPFAGERVPAWIARHAVLVADPSGVRAGVAEHARIGLKLAHDFPGVVPVVISSIVDGTSLASAAVISVAAATAVEPD